MKVEENDEEEYIPTAFIDLDALIEQEQERLIQITLNIILKRLYESARAGRNLLVIQDDMVYNAFTVAGQKLSRILFDRCSLYSVCLTSQRTHEVVFYLNADARTDSITRQFTRMEE
jgi:hypothetical protein